MITALYENERITPTQGIIAKCPECNGDVLPVMGTVNVHHWRHKPESNCHYQQGETEWHRKFKTLFPTHCLEIKKGIHIADVLLSNDTAIEFQNSPIKEDDIVSRTWNYKKIIWVFNITKQNMNGQVSKDENYLKYYRPAKYYHRCGKNLFFDIGENESLFKVESFSYTWFFNEKTQYRERIFNAVGKWIKRTEFRVIAESINGPTILPDLKLF